MYHSHLAFIMVFLAVLTEAVIFVKAMVADLNALAVTVEDFPSFRAIILALLAELAAIVIAIVTEKFRRKFVGAGNTQSVGADIENLVVVLMVLTNGNFSVEVGVAPIRVSAETVAASDVNAMFVAAIFFSLPEIGHAFKFRNFALNKVAIKFRFSLSPTGTAMSVVKATLKQKPVVRAIHEQLPRSFSIVERFRLVGIGGSENNEGYVVASITGAPAVVIAIEDVEAVTGNHSRTAIISFRIRHCEKVTRVNRHKQLEVNFLARKLIGEPGEEMLKLTACTQIRDAERIANRLENPTTFLTRSIGLRRELIDSVNVLIVFVIGTGEKANSAFNQIKFIAVGIYFGRIKNGMSEVVHESVVGIVRLRPVDNDCLQVFVPTLRLAEKFAQSAFAVDRISSETFDELFGNVLVNVVGIGVAEVIVKSRPNVVAHKFFEFVHFENLLK